MSKLFWREGHLATRWPNGSAPSWRRRIGTWLGRRGQGVSEFLPQHFSQEFSLAPELLFLSSLVARAYKLLVTGVVEPAAPDRMWMVRRSGRIACESLSCVCFCRTCDAFAATEPWTACARDRRPDRRCRGHSHHCYQSHDCQICSLLWAWLSLGLQVKRDQRPETLV